ncbi:MULTISPECIES: cation diffusion facilitator family transporter [unclassified Paludibacterium]|uniref:cation diffusion facilitator family transporter n=1 Tax=unclassified Paludibacterium TaxID=2618429 RepID=UPI001C03C29F|nr:cation diffusion facilitator family transporter [Paludibacterium sp. B53371]BEV72741.1 cation diffusion facilitator family transporter [Paludibacterium sp. THUN1379]
MSSDKQQAARLSTQVSVVVNLLLTCGQILTGVLAHSSGLIADGIHSLSDLLADFVVLIANRYSHKAADQDHPYGHFRFETAASLVLGTLLLVVGAGMLWSAGHKLLDPALIPRVHLVALWVALVALLAKEGLFRYMLLVARRVNSGMLTANAWHARSDAASSLVVAVGIIGNLSGWPLLDPLAAGVVGLMVARMGWHFGYDALQDLMDRGLAPEQLAAMRQTLLQTEGVVDAHDLRTRKMGDSVIVDAHLLVGGHISVSEGHQISLRAQQRLMQAFDLTDVTIHIDADQEDGGANLALPSRQSVLAPYAAALGAQAGLLQQAWLHYLDGMIEIELRLPVDQAGLVDRLRAVPLPPHVSAVRIYLAV